MVQTSVSGDGGAGKARARATVHAHGMIPRRFFAEAPGNFVWLSAALGATVLGSIRETP